MQPRGRTDRLARTSGDDASLSLLLARFNGDLPEMDAQRFSRKWQADDIKGKRRSPETRNNGYGSDYMR